MSLFEPDEVPLFSYESAQRLGDTFKQKPTKMPLELPLYQPRVVLAQQPRNDLPLLIFGSLALIGLIGLFLAYFKSRG